MRHIKCQSKKCYCLKSPGECFFSANTQIKVAKCNLESKTVDEFLDKHLKFKAINWILNLNSISFPDIHDLENFEWINNIEMKLDGFDYFFLSKERYNEVRSKFKEFEKFLINDMCVGEIIDFIWNKLIKHFRISVPVGETISNAKINIIISDLSKNILQDYHNWLFEDNRINMLKNFFGIPGHEEYIFPDPKEAKAKVEEIKKRAL